MRTDYFAQIPLSLAGGEVSAGALLGTIETAEGIPLEKFVNAVAVGHATPDAPRSVAVKKEAAVSEVFAVAEASPAGKTETLETAGNVVVLDEGHDR